MCFSSGLLQSQTVWVNAAGDQMWSSSGNWSAGVPTSISAVQFGVQPTGNEIGIDTGVGIAIASITFNSSLSAPMILSSLATETLTVNGAITNLDDNRHVFNLAVNSGANATWTGPLEFKNNVNIDDFSISLSGNTLFSGSAVNFSITNATTYGKILGSGTATLGLGTKINIQSSGFSFAAGNSFDFSSGTFASGSLGMLPILSGGLIWDTTQFYSQGILTIAAVVPEPSTDLMLALGAVGLLIVFRRKRLERNSGSSFKK